jgi:hypothetical protein
MRLSSRDAAADPNGRACLIRRCGGSGSHNGFGEQDKGQHGKCLRQASFSKACAFIRCGGDSTWLARCGGASFPNCFWAKENGCPERHPRSGMLILRQWRDLSPDARGISAFREFSYRDAVRRKRRSSRSGPFRTIRGTCDVGRNGRSYDRSNHLSQVRRSSAAPW